MDTQFTDDEKRFILSEMIKQSRLDVDILVNLIKGFKEFEPDWLKMPLPHGRTVNQCLEAADAMFQTTVERPNLKRKSMGELQEVPFKRRVLPASLGHSTQPSTLTPAAQLPAQSLLNQSSFLAEILSASPGPQTSPKLGRKRGRPSNADKVNKATGEAEGVLESHNRTPRLAPRETGVTSSHGTQQASRRQPDSPPISGPSPSRERVLAPMQPLQQEGLAR
ncbi:hypothetical protein HYQ44_002080 [Verticillium longisporum]|nr:hypothetical protein HYQ44_002080 [Verticillium longisporum]